MSLQKWLEYGWLRSHQSSRKEISDLLRIIDRDLQDAIGDISADWRFGIAYNAALKLCTILIYAEGYSGHMALPEFQRGFVWNSDQVRKLFASLYLRRIEKPERFHPCPRH